jgi:subtilisin family serine protease
MKRLAILGAVALLSSGAAFGGDVAPDLSRILDNTAPDETVSALIYLEDQVDLDAMTAQLNAERVTLKTRHETVVRALQEKAAAAQAPLLAHLAALQAAGRVVDFEAYWIANVINVTATPAEINAIARRADVARAYFNYEIETITPVATRPDDAGGIAGFNPEPGLVAIRAPEAWALGYTGDGALVSSLDTGVDGDHEALASRWRGLDPAYADNPEWAWFDPVTNTTFPQGFGNHGSHTMGTICGGSPGDDIGVAPGAAWIHAAVIDRVNVDQTVADALLAFQWVADPDGDPETNFDVPDVCSNSWGVADFHGYPDCDPLFWGYLDACEAAGVVIVFAAGNEGTSGLRRPADRATDDYRTFAVAAVDGNDPDWPVAGFSSRGPTFCTPGGEAAIKPDISAPGVDVRSANQNGGYYYSDGTSMACPHIAGVVALLRSVNPEIGVDTIKQIIYDTAYDLGDPSEDNTYGWGMVDAYEACLLAEATISLDFTFPDGLPNVIDSDGGSTIRVIVSGTVATPVPDTGKLYYSTGGEFTEVAMTQTAPNEYEAVFPSFACPSVVNYYFSAEASDGQPDYEPFAAPLDFYSSDAWGSTDPTFDDDFESDLGWVPHGSPSLSGGEWERGTPGGSGTLGDPTQDADGSGQCYVTGLADGDDVDNGTAVLYSPIMDGTDPDAYLGYWRWFSSSTTAVPAEDSMVIKISDNGGASWTNLEVIGPDVLEPNGRWLRREYRIADLPDVANTDQLRLAFFVADNSPASTVEGGVDGVGVYTYGCEAVACDADIDGNGAVDVNDFLELLAAWGPNPGHPADLDGNGTVDVADFLELLAQWGPCP